MVLGDASSQIIESLLQKYADREMVTFVGNYLRLFTDSPGLIKGWLNVSRVKTLLRTVLDDDYHIQADAMATIQVSSFLLFIKSWSCSNYS